MIRKKFKLLTLCVQSMHNMPQQSQLLHPMKDTHIVLRGLSIY